MADAVTDLKALIGSRHGLLVTATRDEERLRAIVEQAAAELSRRVWVWSPASGLSVSGGSPQMNTEQPQQALAFLEDVRDPSVAVLLDAGMMLDEPVAARRLKELADDAERLTVILTGVGESVPHGLEGLAIPWRVAAPSRAEMRDVVLRTLGGVSHLRITLPSPEPLVDAVMGLTSAEAERVILREALADGLISEDDTGRIRRLRAELLSQESPLDLIDPAATFDDVGGLDELKKWLVVRARGFEPQARSFGLDAPRGVLLVGVPGCGKSLIARAIAGAWGLPLASLDTGRLHGSMVGESEQRLRRALDSAEVMAPVVLWIDEVEKAFGSADAEHDAGVSQRVLGVLLKWLQERPEGVFVVATSNDVTALPPEVTRRGRFDEVFFVDLPDDAQRQQILAHHLSARHRNPRDYDLVAMSAATKGFSGAELESAVTSSLYVAYAAGQDLSTQHILDELGRTVPLSRMRAEDVSALRTWAQGRARPAG